MDRLFCMQVFVRVVEHQAFNKAAEALGVSRASVTEAVAQLERRLGVRLLNRTTRRVSVTDEGRSYYENCVRILDDIAEAEDGLSGARHEPRGRLRVSVPNSFVYASFFPRLSQFVARYPDLEVEIVFADRAVNLVEEGIDCAVRAVPVPDDSTLIARPISKVKRVTCASPDYLRRHGTPRSVAELAQHQCIRFISPSTGRVADWGFERGTEKLSFAPRGNFALTSLEGAVAAAVAGIGIAQVSDVLALRALRAGALQPLLLEWVVAGPSVMVVYPSNRYLTAKVRAFTEFAAEVYPPEGCWEEILKIGASQASRPRPRRASGRANAARA